MNNDISDLTLRYVVCGDPFALDERGTATIRVDQLGMARLWARTGTDELITLPVSTEITRPTHSSVAGLVWPLLRMPAGIWEVREPVEVPALGRCRVRLLDVPHSEQWAPSVAAE